MLHKITDFIHLTGLLGTLSERPHVLYFRATIFVVMGVELDFTFQLKNKEPLMPGIHVKTYVKFWGRICSVSLATRYCLGGTVFEPQ